MQQLCGASQVRALGVLIRGCYLFELIFEELTPVRVSARTNPFPAGCCCCRCSVLHLVSGDVLVASLTLVLTHVCMLGVYASGTGRGASTT